MNVINFSGGGPQTDPANDAMYVAVHNTVLAGVVPVIAAGNDREDFGLGTTGSPGTAPDAITVAATSSPAVFAPALTVTGGPPSLSAVPIQGAGGAALPAAWSTADQTVVDVATVKGTDGKPVDGHLCGEAGDPNNTLGTLPSGALKGKIALVLRGNCSFISKVERADLAGATGLILIDNRFGEANPLPGPMPIPAGMIADLDGQNLQRVRRRERRRRDDPRVQRHRGDPDRAAGGVITSFSSAGPTDFEHALKPDISAPGLDVLSSTPPKTTGSTFSVFAGTSMATPHIAGAAALLLQRHPAWAPWQVKSALMGTAGPAWGNTARTQEASVLLEGAGLANVLGADDPKIFTAPQSLSFGHIDVSAGPQTNGLLLTLSDAGDGAGSWAVTVAPQAQTTRRDDRRVRPGRHRTGRRRLDPDRRPCRGQRGDRRERRLHRPHAERRRAPRPLRVPGRATRARGAAGGQAAAEPDRHHDHRGERGLDVLLPVCPVRAATVLHRRADERGRLGAPLLDRDRLARCSTSACR